MPAPEGESGVRMDAENVKLRKALMQALFTLNGLRAVLVLHQADSSVTWDVERTIAQCSVALGEKP